MLCQFNIYYTYFLNSSSVTVTTSKASTLNSGASLCKKELPWQLIAVDVMRRVSKLHIEVQTTLPLKFENLKLRYKSEKQMLYFSGEAPFH